MSDGTQTPDQISQMIFQAIGNKNIVIAPYHGYVREMCPHVIGNKNGRARALLYQFAEGSSRGLKPDGSPANWRCLFIDELSDVSIKKSAGKWHTASNHSAAAQHCVEEIELKV